MDQGLPPPEPRSWTQILVKLWNRASGCEANQRFGMQAAGGQDNRLW